MVSTDPLHRCFLAEWYQPDLSACGLDGMTALLDDAATRLTKDGPPVQLLAAIASLRDEILYGLFVAESAQAVSDTCQGAGRPADRITGGVQARVGDWTSGTPDDPPALPHGIDRPDAGAHRGQ
ncbi:hypothetical protein [Mycolicibacterium parafortuitum]|uniref:Uncharacterized protein n=1 Tax=Mycolicibacterium parafortuitum TaxID=39692 RepID=A0A375YNQ3_MYCPF|nr:hypothetical protein [Mycolicibacterium parafortuitum]ORB27546.1 hypothetical protein BST38_24070 [Mycolicibacterium parafortuitum]SRX82787.1 hypothetical protein MPP7335_04553 [Mycolicibacterium parafortuitum]